MRAKDEKLPSRIIDFDALSDLEGSLPLIDATTAPYVHKYQSVRKFLESPYQETRDVDVATITGVGSFGAGKRGLGCAGKRGLGLGHLKSAGKAGTGDRAGLWRR